MDQVRGIGRRWLVLAASATLLAAYVVVGGLAGEIIWDTAVFGQLAIAALVAARFRRHRSAWLLIIAGQACFLAGDIGFTVLEYGLEREVFPSVADVLYLAGYPLMAIGLVPIIRTRRGRRDVGGAIDASIVTVAATAILWVFIMDPTAGDSSGSLLARIVAVAYTAGDVLVLGMLALLLTRGSGNRWPLRLTAASIATLFVADVIYALMALQESYTLGGPIDSLWWVSYTLLTLAVLHPSCDELGADHHVNETRLTPRRLGALAVAALAAPTVLIVRIDSVSTSQATVLLVSTLVLFLLVIVRLQLIAGDLDESRVRLSHEATHDALTGLANRTLLASEVRSALDELQPGSGDQIALLCLDLDDFKPINDLLGHPIGDELLRVIASRLLTTVRDGDVVARLGGDEFAILLRGAHALNAVSVAQRAIEAVARSAEIGGPVEVYPSASIGIVFGDPEAVPDDLVRDSDIAMYSAKRRGKGQWAIFEDGIAKHVMDWLELRAELGAAMAGDQFFVEYQPVVRLDDLEVVGAEALVRWNHPERGIVPPDRFIAVAEDSGLIAPIGAWVLERACLDAQQWSPDVTGPDVSVNVSPKQIIEADLVEHVRRALKVSGLAPTRLVVEITESADISDDAAATAVMGRLREMGVRIALDDLGAGFASLRYLRAFPIDIVKLDRSFMTGLDHDHGLLSGLIGLARSLDLDTVVEGIEHERHERIARDLGAEYGQGYRYARPLSSSSFLELVSGHAGVRPS